ncbi:MAG: precorrin-6y C5,15-methyltransferase (decarboxylating) subunit CbiE, partial [Chloroflexota bacterium]
RAEGRRVTVLASGDPLFYGIGGLLVRRLGREALVFHPHVTCVALAFARIGEPWEDATVLSLHGRDPQDLVPRVRASRKVAILTD